MLYALVRSFYSIIRRMTQLQYINIFPVTGLLTYLLHIVNNKNELPTGGETVLEGSPLSLQKTIHSNWLNSKHR